VNERSLEPWLTSGYFFNPDGSFIGQLHQRRILEPLAHDRLQVTQTLKLGAGLHGHPMEVFTGEWTFELLTEGTLRVLQGPAVVGFGVEWSDHVVTSRGMWPAFGYTFSAYSVRVSEDREIMGGCFSHAGNTVSEYVGVAVPDGGSWPSLDPTAEPPDLEMEADGVKRHFGPVTFAETWPSPIERVRTMVLADYEAEKLLTVTDRSGPNARRVGVSIANFASRESTQRSQALSHVG